LLGSYLETPCEVTTLNEEIIFGLTGARLFIFPAQSVISKTILTILPEGLEVPYFVSYPLSQWATSRACKKQNALAGTYVSSNMHFFGPKSVIFRK
jgi:hypothetical protein